MVGSVKKVLAIKIATATMSGGFAAGLVALTCQPVFAQSTVIASVPNAGSRAFVQCRSCHNLQAQEPDNVGPNLSGFLGKKAGTNRAGFDYSAQMRASPIVWNPASLDRFLEKPTQAIPGTKMAFAGIARADQRQALIAYLQQATSPTNAPAGQTKARK